MNNEFWWENLSVNDHLEYRKEYRMMTSGRTVGECVVRMGGGWNWLRIVSSGRY
jgi:hypothetical protein